MPKANLPGGKAASLSVDARSFHDSRGNASVTWPVIHPETSLPGVGSGRCRSADADLSSPAGAIGGYDITRLQPASHPIRRSSRRGAVAGAGPHPRHPRDSSTMVLNHTSVFAPLVSSARPSGRQGTASVIFYVWRDDDQAMPMRPVLFANFEAPRTGNGTKVAGQFLPAPFLRHQPISTTPIPRCRRRCLKVVDLLAGMGADGFSPRCVPLPVRGRRGSRCEAARKLNSLPAGLRARGGGQRAGCAAVGAKAMPSRSMSRRPTWPK